MADAAAAEKMMLTLRSSDGDEFEVEAAIAAESQTLKRMIEEGRADDVITLPNVSSRILARVIEYCYKHFGECGATPEAVGDASTATAASKDVDDALKYFDADFVKVDLATLFGLILAADYLKIEGLRDLTCKAVANMIKGKTLAQVCKFFNIPGPAS